MSRPIFHHLLEIISFFIVATAAAVCCIPLHHLYPKCTKTCWNMQILPEPFVKTHRIGGGNILVQAEKSNKTNPSRVSIEEEKKVQTQHAWLIRDNVGAPIALNIRINQWRSSYSFSIGVRRTIAIWFVFSHRRFYTSSINVGTGSKIKNTKFVMIECLEVHWIWENFVWITAGSYFSLRYLYLWPWV